MSARYIASTLLYIACVLAAIGVYIAVVALAVARARPTKRKRPACVSRRGRGNNPLGDIMSDHIPTSEVLNRAADLIEERGWGHGTQSMTGVDGLCLMGAIHAASFGHFDEDGYERAAMCPAGRAVYQYLALDSDDADAGWWWNDDRWRVRKGQWSTENPGEVIEVLRATALIESARERETVEVSA